MPSVLKTPAVSESKASPNPTIAIAGNPNCGKSALFNLLTGGNQKIANFPGVTVEKKIGRIRLSSGDSAVIIDLPGTYSLDAETPDEQIAQEILLGLAPTKLAPQPDLVLVVVDSSAIDRHLFLLSQLMEYGLRLIVCLNMFDVASRRGIQYDVLRAEALLQVPVIATVAVRGMGRESLISKIEAFDSIPRARRPFEIAAPYESRRNELSAQLIADGIPVETADFWAGRLMGNRLTSFGSRTPPAVARRMSEFAGSGAEIARSEIEARYRWVEKVVGEIRRGSPSSRNASDRLDRVFLHPVGGPVIFIAVMMAVFQAVFSWAAPLMDGVDALVQLLSGGIGALLPDNLFREFILDGVFAGVGSVVIFLPQILLLFLFITILEDTGYLARAAFLVDRVMVHSGLSGKSFIPMLSGFACAIPAVMATRTIKSEKDRITTIMVIPLMTCSARLPVYTLLIGAFVPALSIGPISLQGLTLFGLYALAVLGAIVAAHVFKRTILKGERSSLILELPDYRVPTLRNILVTLKLRSIAFLTRAGKVILVVSMILWVLSSFPRNEVMRERLLAEGASESTVNRELLTHSYSGMLGRAIEPIIAPLGYDWKVGIAILSSFAAREVFVATIGTIYSVQDPTEESVELKEAMRTDINPRTGQPLFSLPMVLGLLFFFAVALQCLSTVAIIYRETNSWTWPAVALGYTYALAYAGAWAIYQLGSAAASP